MARVKRPNGCSNYAKAAKAIHAAKAAMKCSKAMKAMKAARAMKAAKAMKAAMSAAPPKAKKPTNECKSLPMSAAPPKAMNPMKKWKFLPGKVVQKEGPQEEIKGAPVENVVGNEVVPEWEAIPLDYFWKNGRVKFEYIRIEREA